jgi:hypothetical protein
LRLGDRVIGLFDFFRCSGEAGVIVIASADEDSGWWKMGTLGDLGIPDSFRRCPLRVSGLGIDDDFLCDRLGDRGMEGLRVARMRDGEVSRGDEVVGGSFSRMCAAEEMGESMADFALLHLCDLEEAGAGASVLIVGISIGIHA